MHKFASVLFGIASLHIAVSAASASPSFEVTCSAGKWSGVSLYLKEGKRTVKNDSMELPETTYSIDPYENIATIYTAGKTVNAKVLNRYDGSLSYTVVSYVFGGVNYTDTVYETGFVIVQYAKMSMWGEPYSSTVTQQCKPL